MPCSTQFTTTVAAVISASQNSPESLAPNVTQTAHVDEGNGDGKNDGTEHAAWQVEQRTGQEEENEGHDGGRDELGYLAVPAP